MTTAPATCPRSPRTEKRIFEKQRRREMVMNGDIADKLYRPDLLLDLQYNQSNSSAVTSSPDKSANGKSKDRAEDGLNKMRIEKIMGSYADFKQLRNFQRMPGISFHQSLTPSPTTASKEFKDKRKMLMSRDKDPMDASSGHVTTSSGNVTTSSGHVTTSSGHVTTSSGHVTSKTSTDLRDKINKRRSCESRDTRGQVTHKSLKERVGGPGEGLLEFTKMPGCKVKAEDQSGDERRNKQEKRRYRGSSSSERHRSSSDRRESSGDRRESSEHRAHLSGERRRSSQEQKRSEERRRHSESRKRPYTAGSGLDSDMDSDSTLSTGDIFRLSNIFNVMMSSPSPLTPLPPLPPREKSSSSKPPASSRSVKQEEDSDDEELDLSKFEAKLKIAGVLPSSPGPPDISCSDIDSDQDYDEFPLSKSTLEVSVKEEVSSDRAPEPKVKVEEKPKVKVEEKPKVKVEEKPKMKLEEKPKVKIEEKPKVKLEEKAKLKVEESVKVKVKAEKVDTRAAAAAFSIPTPDISEVEKKDQKPFVAVNPRMKHASLSKEEGPGVMDDLLANMRDNPVTEDNIVDIRKLMSQGTQFNLFLSFGFDKLSTRSLQHPDLVTAIRSCRCKRGDCESSNEEEGKPQEKPSCKVPCIPRTDHMTRVQPEQRGSVSPDRGQSPDPVYHRDKREYGYPPKRRRITREPPEYEQFPHPHPYFPNGIPTALAIPSYAYLVQQPRNLMPPTRAQCTFVSRSQMDDEKSDLEKALKGLLKFDVYNDKGHTLKKVADNATHNQTMKIRKYMEASIQYVYAALSAHQKQDFQSCYIWLHNTANIIDFCLRPRSNHGLDVRIQDKRLAVLCLLLVSHIQRTIWMNRKTEYLNLQKSCNQIIRQKQKEEQSRSLNTTNKSGDSPTPSPASSLVSMASYTGTEVLDTNMHSTTETVPSRLIKDMSKYFKLAQALNAWVDYWEEAGSLAQHSLGFFNYLDEQVCPITPTTHLYTVARYAGQGLENLDKDIS